MHRRIETNNDLKEILKKPNFDIIIRLRRLQTSSWKYVEKTESTKKMHPLDGEGPRVGLGTDGKTFSGRMRTNLLGLEIGY